MKTKVYKVEVLVIDHGNVGEAGIKSLIEDTRYPNHAISPRVKGIESREVEWSDDHPLNMRDTADEAYRLLFEGVET